MYQQSPLNIRYNFQDETSGNTGFLEQPNQLIDKLLYFILLLFLYTLAKISQRETPGFIGRFAKNKNKR